LFSANHFLFSLRTCNEKFKKNTTAQKIQNKQTIIFLPAFFSSTQEIDFLNLKLDYFLMSFIGATVKPLFSVVG